MIIAVVYYWDNVQALERFGYIGAFIISIFGGATVLAPIPMTPAIFALGTVLRPSFAPYLGPVFVGVAAGLGETIGGIIIYLTGYAGGAAFIASRKGRVWEAYQRMMQRMKQRGSLVLFLASVVINPFFYPAAIAAGALRFGIRRYFLICWVGKTIKGMAVAAAGYWGLGQLLELLGLPL